MSGLVAKADAEGTVSTPRFEERGEYHWSSSRTDPYDFDWRAGRLWRWDTPGVRTDETSATRNLPCAVVGRLVGSGLHDFVALNLTPDVVKGIAFKAPAAARGAQPLTVVLLSSSLLMLPGLERKTLGPSSIEGPSWNAIVQGIEDSSFDREFMDAFRPALQDIHRLADLEEGWDSYDASPVDVRTREAAVLFLRQLHHLRRKVPAPSVVASPSGGAILQWDWPGARLSAEIAQDSLRVFVKRADRREYSVLRPNELGELVTRILDALP